MFDEEKPYTRNELEQKVLGMLTSYFEQHPKATREETEAALESIADEAVPKNNKLLVDLLAEDFDFFNWQVEINWHVACPSDITQLVLKEWMLDEVLMPAVAEEFEHREERQKTGPCLRVMYKNEQGKIESAYVPIVNVRACESVQGAFTLYTSLWHGCIISHTHTYEALYDEEGNEWPEDDYPETKDSNVHY